MLEAFDGREVLIVAKPDRQSKVRIAAHPQLKAIVLLAVNAGLGNTDIGNLQSENLSDDGWPLMAL
jgi:hypothetical protein